MRRLLFTTATLLIGCGGIAVIDPDSSTASGGGGSGSGSGGGFTSSTTTTSAGGSDPSCTSDGRSSLEGVTIEFPSQRCSYTLAEAAAGIDIRYQVVVSSTVDGVSPQPQDSGQCDLPSSSGLTVFELLAGNGQSYCRCDTGFCAPPPNVPVQLQPGTYDDTFSWDGVNWFGPSDTGNPPGAPFPPGSYELRVSAIGTRSGTSFEVLGTFELTLVP